MIERPFWIKQVESAWERAPIAWLSGVRRVGKTTLAKHWNEATFVNCDIPDNRRELEDPLNVFRQLSTKVVVFDEVHKIEDPSTLLKIGADEFPELRILATGSSTLAATKKFKDSLTGRKRSIHLTPVLVDELPLFGRPSLKDRLLRGGLPDCLLAAEPDPSFYAEWIDSFYARDVQELYPVGKRNAFLSLVELLFRQSGDLIEVTSLAKHCGISRPTVLQYLEILEITHALRILRPYSGGGRREIIAQPKAYGFDTGFVCHLRGWESLAPEHCGLLLEHIVLDLLSSHLPNKRIFFWRDRQQREIDFVLQGSNGEVDAIECKWNKGQLSPRNLDAFRRAYPRGKNLVVTGQSEESFSRKIAGHQVQVCNVSSLLAHL